MAILDFMAILPCLGLKTTPGVNLFTHFFYKLISMTDNNKRFSEMDSA